MFAHVPASAALRAAATARSMSSRPALATVAMVEPSEGFRVSNVFPSAASANSPSMNSWYSRM